MPITNQHRQQLIDQRPTMALGIEGDALPHLAGRENVLKHLIQTRAQGQISAQEVRLQLRTGLVQALGLDPADAEAVKPVDTAIQTWCGTIRAAQNASDQMDDAHRRTAQLRSTHTVPGSFGR